MKKVICFLFALMVCYAESSFAQKLNTITIQLNNEKTFVSSTNDLDSITYTSDEGSIMQMIWEKDSLYRIPLQDIESTVIEVIDIPEMVVVKQNVGEWDDIRFCNDGNIISHKKYAESDIPECVVIASKDTERGNIISAIAYKEDGTPKFIGINDYCIILDSVYKDSVDLMVVYKDSIALCYKGLPFSDSSLLTRQKVIRRAWGQMDWRARTSAVLDIASGVAGVTIASIVVTGAIFTEGMTLGASTLAALGGISMFVNAGKTIDSGLKKILIKDYKEDVLSNSIIGAISQGSQTLIDIGQVINKIPDKFTIAAGWALFGANIMSQLFYSNGRVVITSDLYKYYQNKVLTGINKDITSQSAILRGYVYPEITRNLLDGKKLENEYGITLYEGSSSQPVSIKKIINGEGGMIEFLFDNLKPDTQYSYQTYYLDKTNTLSVYGERKSFKTEKVFNNSVVLSDFNVTNAQYKKGEFINDNVKYDYRFDVSVTATLNTEDVSYVTEWGYVYEDPNGKKVEIPLSGFGTKYTDSRYAYFRNTPHSTARLYGYVYIIGSDQPICSEVHDYPLDYYTPSATTGDYSNITKNSATVSCTYENVPEGGVCGVEYIWNEGSVSKSIGSKEGTQEISLSGLEPGTTYTYRAYIEAYGQTYYGEEKTFTTNNEIPDIAGLWHCKEYQDGTQTGEGTFELNTDGTVTRSNLKNSGSEVGSSTGRWSINADGYVHINFEYLSNSGASEKSYSGTINSFANPTQIEGKATYSYTGNMGGGTRRTYDFIMTR